MIFKITISTILAYLLMKMIVPYFNIIFKRLGFVDKAGLERKIHTHNIPITGGLAMGVSIFLIMSMHANDASLFTELTASLLTGAMLLMLTGIVDDKIDLNPFFKLAIQLYCASFLVIKGLFLDQVFELVQLGMTPLYLKKAISILLIIGVVNAYNLIDGIDGLAGSLFFAAFTWLGATAAFMGRVDIAFFCMVIMAVVFAFLGFNISVKDKTFMGDGGSLPLGYLLSGLSIAVLEGGATSSHASVILIGTCALLSIPIFDEARVFLARINAGRSPFYADKTHIHHILLQISPKHSTVRNWIISGMIINFSVSVILATLSGVLLAGSWFLLSFFGLWTILTQQRNMYLHRQALQVLEKPWQGASKEVQPSMG
jgi:UDP-GlcNAc:undecaprenyl-phosphate GlcNAc-1-phosphate transferase